ncbi:MAG: S41 family peptidase [Pyrinomonadaceae bacterium]
MKKHSSVIFSIAVFFGIFIFSKFIIVAQQPNQPPDMAVDGAVKSEVIDTLLKDLTENYVFPDVAKRMADDIRARQKKKEYDGIDSARAFAGKLTEDLQSISKDKHLRVRYSDRVMPIRQERSEPTEEEKAEQARFTRMMNYGFEKLERLPGNIGYVNLRGFFDAGQPGAAETVAAAMKFLSYTDALIFDLRQNGGGDPDMVALISSYLFGDKPVHLNSLYWRKGDQTNEFWTKPDLAANKFADKEVYVLTSNRTFSAAEEFSYNLKSLKRATIVGETTGGGAHPGGVFRLGDHFGAFISTGRAINPITKTNWEGTGVEPDIKVPQDQALLTAHLSAMDNLLKKTGDEDLKNALRRQIEETRKQLDEMKKNVAKK